MPFQRIVMNILVLFIYTKACVGSGNLEITLQSYRFDFGGSRSQTATPSPNANKATREYVENYKPEWRLAAVFNSPSQEPKESKDKNQTAVSPQDWPWHDTTECQAPTRYRFLVCLDYADDFDPSRSCRLERIQTSLTLATRVPFRSQFGRDMINFDNLLGMTPNSDVIPNPFKVNFNEWKGPLSLAVFVRCCGAVAMVEGQCDEILSTTITIWPRPMVQGKRSLRYSLDGRGSMTFAVNANCDEHYYGRSCDIFCQVDNPAVEHAFCNASTGMRQCLKGWEGLDCQTDTNECQGLVCKNGGKCVNSQGTFTCKCPFSTRGRHCELRYSVCHVQPCQHQGTCLETPSGSLCFCMPGFEGQWCHLLEGQEDALRRAITPFLNSSTITPIINPAGQGGEYRSRSNNIQVNEVVQRTNENEDSPRWHHWYLAIIAASLLVICLVLIVMFLTYRSRIRKQYRVNVSPTPPPANTTTSAASPRVFDNAMYQKDDPSSLIRPTSFNIFYESKCISSIIKNDPNVKSPGKVALPKMNNNIDRSLLLDVNALKANPNHDCVENTLADDHEYGFDDRTTLTNKRRGQDSPIRTRRIRDNTANVQTHLGNANPSQGCYEMATLRKSTPIPNNNTSASGYLNPRLFYAKGSVHHYEPENSLIFRPENPVENSNHGQNDTTLYSAPPQPSHSRDRWVTPPNEPCFKPEPNKYSKSPAVQQFASKTSHYGSKKPDQRVSVRGSNEHEYEDVGFNTQGYEPKRPTPKPRHFVQQGQQTTMQIRMDKCPLSQEYGEHGIQDRQVYQRRYSDGLIDESTRRPVSARYDIPVLNGKLSHQHNGRDNARSRHRFNPPYVSAGDLRIVPPGKLYQSPKKPVQSHHGAVPITEDNISKQRQIVTDKGHDTNCHGDLKRRRSSMGSGKFPFRRNSKHQIYRNTDIPRFDVDHNGGIRKSKTVTSRDSSNFTSNSNTFTATSSPKSDRLFGRKRMVELKGNNEMSVDASMWNGDDGVIEDRSATSYEATACQSSSIV